MFNQSLISVFGLLFGQELEAMGHGTTGVALVSNISNMVTCFSGLIMGPVLKTYSCRRVTLCGAIITSSGLILTSFATSLFEVIIFYSVFAAFGLGLMYPATFVAIKGYFTSKRGRAVGLSMAGTGVGQMLMPQAVRFLLDEFGYRWTTRIIGALCLHGVAGALLFQVIVLLLFKCLSSIVRYRQTTTVFPLPPQPVRWHLKKSNTQELLQDVTKVSIEDKQIALPENNIKVNLKEAEIEKDIREMTILQTESKTLLIYSF